jgi:hypothetical protein
VTNVRGRVPWTRGDDRKDEGGCVGKSRRRAPHMGTIAPSPGPRTPLLNIHLSLTPVISLIAGILVLVMPKLLNYIVAFYLIAIGVIGILGLHQLRLG